MDKSVFDRHRIQLDIETKTQRETFHAIIHIAYEAGYMKDENAYFEDMCEREKEAAAGFQDRIAIPHSKHATCIKPRIFLVKFERPTAWSTPDGEPVQVALGLTIPEDGDDMHLCILSKLAHKTISEEPRVVLRIGTDVDTLYEVIAAVGP